MLDTHEFIGRLELVLSHYELSAATFADSIQVQRSSISHLLKGRNKPSLEFVMKITQAYPEIDLQWLLYGKGIFPKSKSEKRTLDIAKEKIKASTETSNTKTVERIVIFYTDGTFKNYTEQ